MNLGDITTKTIKMSASGSYLVVFERDWLEAVGYSQAEIESGEIEMVFKCEISPTKKLVYIGCGKPRRG